MQSVGYPRRVREACVERLLLTVTRVVARNKGLARNKVELCVAPGTLSSAHAVGAWYRQWRVRVSQCVSESPKTLVRVRPDSPQ